MKIIGFSMALVMLGAICMAYPFIVMVSNPPAQDAFVDPGLVDEPDQGDDQLDGDQDVEVQTPKCHYKKTRFLGGVQYCGETIICFILATILAILATTIAVILFIKKKIMDLTLATSV